MPTNHRVSIAEQLVDDAQLGRLEVMGATEELALLWGELENHALVTGDPKVKVYTDRMGRQIKIANAGLTEVFVALRDLRETPGFKRASKEKPWDGTRERRQYDRRAVQREAQREIAATIYEDRRAA